MPEFNPDDVNPYKQEIVVLQSIQPHRALLRANRFLLNLVFLLIALVFVLGFVLLPRQGDFLDSLGRTRLTAATQNPVLTAEVKTLKAQMFGLVSGSIDSKLKSLEDNLRKGSLADSLDTLQALKAEVKLLDSYAREPAVKAEQLMADQEVIKELSELKGLIYLTIASCGLMVAALAGAWLRHRYLLTHQQKPPVFLRRQN